MRQTPITYIEPVLCPDCGTGTHLMGGKFGRFYKCLDHRCAGTIGARLDGTPRRAKTDPATQEAREAARDAIRLVLTLLGSKPNEFSSLNYGHVSTFEESRAYGPDPIDGAFPEALRLIQEALEEDVPLEVWSMVGLPRKALQAWSCEGLMPTSTTPKGLFLRGRSKEEAVAIAKAATKVAADLQFPSLDRLIADPLGPQSEDVEQEPERTR